MSVIRIHKNKNFTVMSNIHLRDKNLSLKAKGLLSLMFSLPDDWSYSVAGLCAICKEKETSVKNTLNELRDRRYVIVERTEPSKETGGRIQYEYFVYEQPQGEENKKVDVKEAYKLKQDRENQPQEKQGLENLGVECLPIENQGGVLNTNILSTDKLNTNKRRTDKPITDDNSSSKDEDSERILPEGGHNSSSGGKKTAVRPTKKLSESELDDAVSQMPLRAGNLVYHDTGDRDMALSVKAFMQYFLNQHKKHTNTRHAILTDEVLRRVIETVTSEIPIMQDGYMLVYVPLVTEDYTARDYEKIVDIYFSTKFKQKIDYSIVHFTSKGVLTNMMNHDEEIWYMSESLQEE